MSGATAESDGSSSSATSTESTGSGPQTDSSSGSSVGESTESGSSTTTGATCEPSASDIEGPFYRPGIPIGSDLDIHGDLGEPLLLSGRVLDENCQPIDGAIVEIWHATPVLPDAEPGDVNATYDDSRMYRYYGQVATDSEGQYDFTTLRPGWYLNGGSYRPAHVHVKIWVEDEERLTTQLYFEGDPFNDDDPWYNEDMELSPDMAGSASFDFVV